MRYVILTAVLVVSAFVVATILCAVENAAFRDALLDFLDEPTTDKVIAQREAYRWSRIFGVALVLSLWAVLAIGLDRLYGLTIPERRGK